MTAKKTTPTKKAAAKKPAKKKTVKKVKTVNPEAEATLKTLQMHKPDASDPAAPPKSIWEDYDAFSSYMNEVGDRGKEIMEEYLKQHAERGRRKAELPADPLNMGETMQDTYTSFMSNPYNMMRMQFGMWEDYVRLCETMSKKAMGQDVEPVIEPDMRDRRFSHEAWSENQTLDFVKQSYLLMCRWARDMVEKADDLDEHTKRKAAFYTEQFLAAIAPTNFATTNPEVIEETLKTKGDNFMRGFQNFLEDIERGHGELSMKQADMDYFKVGENIATTPGKVVFQNDLLQLIQYSPVTEEVAERPLLILPPWINKFYILDLQPENSLISWLVEQGRTVFVVSWVNPDTRHAQKTFEDYMYEGVYAAVDAVEKETGVSEVDTIGYCIGGTLLSVSLAHMAARGDKRIASATFFTAQMDFQEAGDLLLFIDDEQIENIEKQIEAAGGILEASAMSKTFNMLRPIDLIWSVYVDNYLKGKQAKRFDLLFWNSDATRMAKSVYLFYLKEFYQHNRLSKGEMELGGEKLDLSKVTIPIFMQSGEKDHIAPYRSIYRSARLYGGPVTFMLAGSGHIAGVINHPDKKKYHYSTNESLPETVEEWLEGAERHEYSWWPHWMKWLEAQNTKKVPAREPGAGGLEIIEDAPGSYVRVMSDD